MGRACAFDLARSKDVQKVTLVDSDSQRIHRTTEKIGSRKIEGTAIDIRKQSPRLMRLLMENNAAISAVPYEHNFHLAKVALQARTNFCDLGGNDSIVESELRLNRKAERAGINIIPNCGLAPGLVNILASHGAQKVKRINKILLRVGGLPKNPRPPLNYSLLFSAKGLINEYLEKATIIQNGKVYRVPPLSDLEQIVFPKPFGKLEAFHTSGVTSELVRMFRGKVNQLDYKTIRYPGHCEMMKSFLQLGLASEEPIDVSGHSIKPREMLERLLEKNLQLDHEDVVLLRVTISGMERVRRSGLVFEMIEHYDPKNQLGALERTTAFPASVIAQMMASGKIEKKGSLLPESCVPPFLFLEGLGKRGIRIETIDLLRVNN